MTIHAFCREQLMTHGPLTLETLTDLAVAAGVTRSATPLAGVRESLRGRTVHFPTAASPRRSGCSRVAS